MRKLVIFMHYSLNGFVAGPKGSLDWTNMREDQISEFMFPDMQKTCDSMLLGRKLFEGFQQYWPAAAADPNSPPDLAAGARWIDESPKYVVSHKQRELGWKNSRLIVAPSDTELVAGIKKLKRSKGGDIVVFGGARLSQALARLDLIDEYRLKLETAVIGEGVPLFKGIKGTRKFKLTLAKPFDSGVMCLYYSPDR